LSNKTNILFLGIGGIGMSALARCYLLNNYAVFGYDKTETDLTQKLKTEGAEIFYIDRIEVIPPSLNPENTQVVYTPAIPSDSILLNYLIEKGFNLKKRAQILGEITQNYKLIAVAGTHGKTTTSALVAHILNESKVKICAFLGGIANNFSSNFIYNQSPEYCVVEADEFDRSFHTLNPQITVLTSTDADHLDIYNTSDSLLGAYQEFIDKIPGNGVLIKQGGVSIKPIKARVEPYSIEPSPHGFSLDNLKIINAQGAKFSVKKNDEIIIKDILFKHGSNHNLENALAAIAVALECGAQPQEIKKAIENFTGIKRRFNTYKLSENSFLIDDYAHHPTELNALIKSVKELFEGYKIKLVFQPHLFSRTKDFFNEFTQELARVDELILLPIYPAREKPIEGVNSQALLDNIKLQHKKLVAKTELLKIITVEPNAVTVIAGAGDVGVEVEKIVTNLTKSDIEKVA
jgi:UDP-N-acetylmuramate--alanine ligase